MGKDGKVWDNLRTNLSKYSCSFSDFPPQSKEDFPTAEDMRKYLASYCKAFGLENYIQFNSEALNVEKLEGKWKVEVKGKPSRIFDFVCVSSGFFSRPHIPSTFKDTLDRFKGRTFHSSEYKNPSIFRGKRVLVVGGAFSGSEIAADIVREADRTTLVARRPMYYIPRIIKASKLGDAAILKEIIKILAQNKIKTENSLKFNSELSLKKGNYSKIKPNKQDQIDIKKAIKTLNNLRQYNFSQGVVVRNKKVVSIEGKGGTKKMLENSRSKKFKNQGVLVKFPKKKQDLRVDLPTIGLKTIKQSKTAGLKGIVIKSKQHVFLDKKKCIKFANKNKIFISVK